MEFGCSQARLKIRSWNGDVLQGEEIRHEVME
jgi:hypothetical protein